MSITTPKKTDSLNNYFTNLNEFNNMKEHLLDKPDFDGFIRWFDKLRMIEPRATWIFLQQNKDRLTDEQITVINNAYQSIFPNGL